MSAYVGEFLGTFVLVFVITLVVALFVNPQGTGSDFAVSGLTQGLVLLMLVATLGRVSGGHFNPAVTIGAAVLRKISPMDALMYVLVQLIGGILGAFMTYFVLVDDLAKQTNVGAASLNLSLVANPAAGMVLEALGTFFLVWAVVAMAMNVKAPKDWAPLVIGFTFAFIVMILGSLTGAAVNPARWFGPALVAEVAGGIGFTKVWVYLIGDIAGGLLGALTYWYLFIDRDEKSGAPGPPRA